MVGAKGNHSQEACALYGGGKPPLVLGTDSRLSACFDLVPIGQESPETVYLLVVYLLHVVHAEGAYLTSGVITGSASSPGWARTLLCHALPLNRFNLLTY